MRATDVDFNGLGPKVVGGGCVPGIFCSGLRLQAQVDPCSDASLNPAADTLGAGVTALVNLCSPDMQNALASFKSQQGVDVVALIGAQPIRQWCQVNNISDPKAAEVTCHIFLGKKVTKLLGIFLEHGGGSDSTGLIKQICGNQDIALPNQGPFRLPQSLFGDVISKQLGGLPDEAKQFIKTDCEGFLGSVEADQEGDFASSVRSAVTNDTCAVLSYSARTWSDWINQESNMPQVGADPHVHRVGGFGPYHVYMYFRAWWGISRSGCFD